MFLFLKIHLAILGIKSKFKCCHYVNMENIINFEFSENFPNLGFIMLVFPVRKTLGPLP